ncbi:hypothetical protein KSP40_PGU003908 [Platanthera guangdongensis]|uniref:Uncharacterized protein n=1 Tax=Platanthera guangdongensis TaxID=2320717 RepID=A0ABR2LWH8_9ASPA
MFRTVYRASRIQSYSSRFRRLHSHTGPDTQRPSFGISFDIDGVLIRGGKAIGGSPQALRRLYGDDGGGFPESKRASELSELLGVQISPLQVVQGHSPFRDLVSRFGNDLIVAVGKGEPAKVMLEYGFKNVLSIDEYASFFKGIDPLSRYKNWTFMQNNEIMKNMNELDFSYNVNSDAVKGTFIVSDPVDWGRDIQVKQSFENIFPDEEVLLGVEAPEDGDFEEYDCKEEKSDDVVSSEEESSKK